MRGLPNDNGRRRHFAIDDHGVRCHDDVVAQLAVTQYTRVGVKYRTEPKTRINRSHRADSAILINDQIILIAGIADYGANRVNEHEDVRQRDRIKQIKTVKNLVQIKQTCRKSYVASISPDRIGKKYKRVAM